MPESTSSQIAPQVSAKTAPGSVSNLEAVRHDVMRCRELEAHFLATFFSAFGLTVEQVSQDQTIPGSHWGDDEAGLIRNRLYVRDDTPVHSALHEACHWLLMDQERRDNLHTNAGGSQVEENAVCFLQIVLADFVPGMDRDSMCRDMDIWGYSFRLGSAAAWFTSDAVDAFDFLKACRWIAADAAYEDASLTEKSPVILLCRTSSRT